MFMENIIPLVTKLAAEVRHIVGGACSTVFRLSAVRRWRRSCRKMTGNSKCSPTPTNQSVLREFKVVLVHEMKAHG